MLSHSHLVPTPQTANVWTSGRLGSTGGESTGGSPGTGVCSCVIACPPEQTTMTSAQMRPMHQFMDICRLHSRKAIMENGDPPRRSGFLPSHQVTESNGSS